MDQQDCYKNHDYVEEVHLSGANLNADLPDRCYVCGFSPVTYAPLVAVYDEGSGFVGMKHTS